MGRWFYVFVVVLLMYGNYSVADYHARCFGINMPKSRDIQAKMPSPKVILNAFLLVTVKLLNSYDVCSISFSQTRSFFNHINLFHHSVSTGTQPAWLGSLGAGTLCGRLEQALRSDTYGDFRLGQLTQVNIVAVSG